MAKEEYTEKLTFLYAEIRKNRIRHEFNRIRQLSIGNFQMVTIANLKFL